MHVYSDPYPIRFGGGNWITVVTNVTGTFTGEMTLPDGTVILVIRSPGELADLEHVQAEPLDLYEHAV
jgi:hypothetical protein